MDSQNKCPEIRLKPETLEQYSLPDIGYPLSVGDFEAALSNGGDLPWAVYLCRLQERMQDGESDWKSDEVAVDRLTQLVTPDDSREVIVAAGEEWWLEFGPVDLDQEIVTFQRQGELIAALAPREDGALRVAVYRPLDARSASSLIKLGQKPHPEGGVCMRENNWEYTLDASAALGCVYASEGGKSYLSYWQKGIGVEHDGTEIPEWRAKLRLQSRPASRGATEVGVYYSLSGSEY
ncbi:MAG: hypothetical protein KJO21_10275 [Verrucomicrobiae bacterium]|nr:hypothetical protein [Verrucomicrobiae bacterium]NNJ42320.1 hypothetical protein [Akkermansiaceae bacterium]